MAQPQKFDRILVKALSRGRGISTLIVLPIVNRTSFQGPTPHWVEKQSERRKIEAENGKDEKQKGSKETLLGNEKLNTNLFSQTFRAPPQYPGKVLGYPAKKFGFPVVRRTCRTFWPPPLQVEDPHPIRKYPDQKVWVWVPFSSLN